MKASKKAQGNIPPSNLRTPHHGRDIFETAAILSPILYNEISNLHYHTDAYSRFDSGLFTGEFACKQIASNVTPSFLNSDKEVCITFRRSSDIKEVVEESIFLSVNFLSFNNLK